MSEQVERSKYPTTMRECIALMSYQELSDYHKEIRHAYDSRTISYKEAVRLAKEATPPEDIRTMVTLAILRGERNKRWQIATVCFVTLIVILVAVIVPFLHIW